MDEQRKRSFKLQESRSKQEALRASIKRELALYREDGQIEPSSSKEPGETQDLRKQMVDTRVKLEQARQKVSFHLDSLTDGFDLHERALNWIKDHPHETVGVVLSIGIYFGLKR